MTTFTATGPAVTVTITGTEFADDAQRDAREARRAACRAAVLACDARMAATYLPADWTSPGGASAADVLALIAADQRSASRSADAATRAAQRARRERNRDAQRAAWAAEDARICRRSAEYDRDSVARLLAYLTA